MTRKAQRAMRTWLAALSVAFTSLLWVPTASAWELMICTFKISAVQTTPYGRAWITASGLGSWMMCDVNSNMTVDAGPVFGNYTITPSVCQSWVAQFLTAKTTQQSFTVFVGYSGTAPTCAFGVIGNGVVPYPFPYAVSFSE